MILSVEHFLKRSYNNVANMKLENITSVHCYHATRLPSKDCITKNGLLLPTVERLSDQLTEIGIDDVDKKKMHKIIGRNGGNIYVQMNRIFLLTHCEYHTLGSEKIRRYSRNISELLRTKLRDCCASMKGYILEINLPVNFFDWNCLAECRAQDNLFDRINEIDITLEVTRNIPYEYICDMCEVEI